MTSLKSTEKVLSTTPYSQKYCIFMSSKKMLLNSPIVTVVTAKYYYNLTIYEHLYYPTYKGLFLTFLSMNIMKIY